MFAGMKKRDVEKKIQVFLDPTAGTLAHGRPIYYEEAKTCGLNIEEIDVKAPLWGLLNELYVRTDRFVSRDTAKAIESKKEAFHVAV